MKSILSTKLFIFAAAYVTCGISVNSAYFILLAIFIDIILRLVTAGLTFNYGDYPNEISHKKIDFFRWVSTVFVCLSLSALVRIGVLF